MSNTALYNLGIVAVLLANWKITKIPSFWISTEFSFFLDLKFVLVGLFLIYFFIAQADIVIYLFLNFEQKWA